MQEMRKIRDREMAKKDGKIIAISFVVTVTRFVTIPCSSELHDKLFIFNWTGFDGATNVEHSMHLDNDCAKFHFILMQSKSCIALHCIFNFQQMICASQKYQWHRKFTSNHLIWAHTLWVWVSACAPAFAHIIIQIHMQTNCTFVK